MTHGSLFSGIGGFDLAAEWMGWENKFHCEINPFCQKVLKYHFPNSIGYEDIKKTDFKKWNGAIDIISGGFPCQPYSLAGKRKGKEDDRHLWPEMLRAIREIQPRWVVGENVFGLLNWNKGVVFHEVQTDLEAAGYIVFPYVLPACSVNAPHRRDRVWIVAYNNKRSRQKHELRTGRNLSEEWYGEARLTPDTNSTGNRNRMRNNGEWQKETEKRRREQMFEFRENGKNVTNPNNDGCNTSNGEHEVNTSQGRFNALNDVEPLITADTGDKRLQRSKVNGSIRTVGQNGNEQFAGCVPSTWDKFPTQPPICSRNDGLSGELVGITFSKHRAESIKAYGNSIVPQIVYQIFKAIEEYELLQNSNNT